jgi:hypothetical protein
MTQTDITTLSPEERAAEQVYIWRCGCKHTLPYGANALDPANIFPERARIAKQNPCYIDADCSCVVCPKLK